LAKITGEKPLSVIAIVKEKRAIASDDKAAWRRLASAAAIAYLMLGSLPSQAHNTGGMNTSPLYALCEMARFLSEKLRRLWTQKLGLHSNARRDRVRDTGKEMPAGSMPCGRG
jgi:hypothetical protein